MTLAHPTIDQMRGEKFDRDDAIQLDVAGFIDDTHAPGAELL